MGIPSYYLPNYCMTPKTLSYTGWVHWAVGKWRSKGSNEDWMELDNSIFHKFLNYVHFSKFQSSYLRWNGDAEAVLRKSFSIYYSPASGSMKLAETSKNLVTTKNTIVVLKNDYRMLLHAIVFNFRLQCEYIFPEMIYTCRIYSITFKLTTTKIKI